MKVRLSLLIIGVMVIGLLGGVGTYAWFTDQAVSSNNIFDVGTLEINPTPYGEIPTPLFSTNYEDSTWNTLFAVGEWYPGKKVPESGEADRGIALHNTGSLSAKIYGVSAVMTDFITPEGHPNYDGAKDEFSENMIITVKCNGEVYYQDTLKKLLTSIQPLSNVNTLSPNPAICLDYNFEAEMSTEAGNIIQGTTATVDLIIHATQDNDFAVNDMLNN